MDDSDMAGSLLVALLRARETGAPANEIRALKQKLQGSMLRELRALNEKSNAKKMIIAEESKTINEPAD